MEERRLLLVGRDPMELAFLKTSLEPRGYTVAVAQPGEGVWGALEVLRPQIVGIDVHRGLNDPLEDLVRIKDMLPADLFVPVFALYPDKVPADIIRGFQRGADDFVVRPFELFELILRLEVLWRMKMLQDQILATNKRLHALSITDDLTGLCNQGEFKRRMALELRRVSRFSLPVAVIFFDCDRFKLVNDTFGHAVGSHVLKEIARILVANLRDTDVLCRYGGDEFVIGLPGCDLARGIETAERLRNLVKMSTFRLGAAEVRCTLSMGVEASTPETPWDLDTILKRSDKALYLAKAQGRDRVCTPEPDEVSEENSP
ncbi:MAG: GGDEF domain-containing protein [Bradymonadia bacterium]